MQIPLGDLDLVRGIQTSINNGEFVLVLRTDGRIVAMSDEVEHHLGKTMVKKETYFSLRIVLFFSYYLAFVIHAMY